ncbi:hypothetical protein ACFSQT_23095 [Mesorhizobium calcicola]|uniref:Uncharacterized protein n=1 Tax=Mesorhizobium calcicola TaxID=1300310 RepID=A0ABW4WIF2_9HYPH
MSVDVLIALVGDKPNGEITRANARDVYKYWLDRIASEKGRADGSAPHISVEPREDPDGPREIKTASSARKVPLVGVALEVFSKHRRAFHATRRHGLP